MRFYGVYKKIRKEKFKKLFNLLFKFLKGYVIIELYGRGAERFLNICTRRGIGVRNASRNADGSVTVCVSRQDFKLLRPIAYKTHTRVHIVKKKGFRELHRRYKNRFGLIAGFVLFFVFMFVAPRFIWTVNISGNESVSTESIRDALREAGIYPGAPKSKIPDGFTVKRIIIKRNPELMWAWAYISGTTADIQVSERELPPLVVDRDEPCSIAASCDAYIKSIRALNGERIADGGSVVQAGDTLVSGRVPVYKEGAPEKYMYVHARAEVEAYTERRESGVYRLEYEHRTPTGRAENRVYLDLFGKRINLYAKEESSYELYDTSEAKYTIPGVTLGLVTYSEVLAETEPMSLEGCLQEAKEDLEMKISKRLGKNAVLIDEDIQYDYVSENEITVRLTMSCMEDIGVEMPVAPETGTEEISIDKQEN